VVTFTPSPTGLFALEKEPPGEDVCRGWNELSFLFKPINIIPLVDET
jgi:hypothetical protein